MGEGQDWLTGDQSWPSLHPARLTPASPAQSCNARGFSGAGFQFAQWRQYMQGVGCAKVLLTPNMSVCSIVFVSERDQIEYLKEEVAALLQRVADLEFLLRRIEPRVQVGERAWGMIALQEHEKVARQAQQKGV